MREASPVGGGGDVGVGSYPPLYYAILAVPYLATGAVGGGLLDQLVVMRLVSALFAGGTALLVFLFLRELLPRARWAWWAGGLACALQPLAAFVAGGVNPDSLLALFCAGLLYVIARAFRRGLTVRVAVALGGLLAAAMLTKLSAVGLAPGVAVAVALLLWRQRNEDARRSLRVAGAAALAFGAPLAVYLLFNKFVWGRPLVPGAGQSVGGSAVAGGGELTLSGYLSYTWQLVFPKLSSMHDWQPGFLPNEVWFRGWVGRFGWGGIVFDPPVYRWALVVLALLVAGVLVTFARFRRSLARRLPEAASYLALVAGLVVFYGYVGYSYLIGTELIFEQARYLLPLFGLYGALVALAVAGLGRRLGPPVTALVVVLALAHNVAAVMLVVGRYYA
jgi:4-amino-4-deoxy-L-arabinose transferase-like glycosyltransferase